MKKQIAPLVLALAAAAPALAAPETYVLDGTHSFPRFSYSHFGYSTQLSRFDRTSGKIVFDKAAKTGAVDIVIDTKSVNTGYPTFNEHIQARISSTPRSTRPPPSSRPRSCSRATSRSPSRAT
jgi:polyisoprenoid-binding protein YceI